MTNETYEAADAIEAWLGDPMEFAKLHSTTDVSHPTLSSCTLHTFNLGLVLIQ